MSKNRETKNSEIPNLIKATDIMIGNYFQYENKIVFIAEILKAGLVTIYNGSGIDKGTSLRCLRPIALTEEILLKCGFEKRNTDQIRYKRDTIELTHVEFWDEDDDGNEFSFKEWKLSELHHSDLFYYKSFPSIDTPELIQGSHPNRFKSRSMNNIKQLIEEESNEHKDETDYIASQEYICGCSNENDKLFCWEASTACSIQARESFQAGASFILSRWQEANRWRKVSEELPKYNQDVIAKLNNGDKVIIHYCYEEYFVTENGIEYLKGDVIEWKPID